MPCTNYNQVFCNFLGSEDLYSGEADSKLWTFFLTQKIDLKQIEKVNNFYEQTSFKKKLICFEVIINS